MLRNFVKAANVARTVLTTAHTVALRPTRALSISAASSRTSIRTLAPARNVLLSTRNHSSTTPRSIDVESKSASPQDISWIDLLESASKAPWLTIVPEDHQDRLRRAYTLLFQVILYLGRPMAEETAEAEAATQQFLLAFNSAPVAADSEIGRARYAIGLLTKTITNNISTIPILASVRTQHSQVFDLTDALVPLCEVHLEGLAQGTTPLSGEIVEEGKWQDFWTRAQPIVLALAEELDKEGYGIGEKLMKKARAEQEKKEREAALREETK